jgi:non-canonical (house-cleaning) NTP pyrophosphatase
MLSNAHRAVTESEEVGLEITAELARNREKIESSRAKVGFWCGVGGGVVEVS